jgi:hypothetical protein
VLENARQIVFYLPSMVFWDVTALVLAVGGVTSNPNEETTKPFCFGVVVDPRFLTVRHGLTEVELKSQFGGECAVFTK